MKLRYQLFNIKKNIITFKSFIDEFSLLRLFRPERFEMFKKTL